MMNNAGGRDKSPPYGTLILTASEISHLMKFRDYMTAVEEAFAAHATGRILGAGVLDLPGKDGMFHAKGATMQIKDRLYVAVKINGNFPQNSTRFGLPTIQGAILLCDGEHGNPLAFLDSIEITVMRTGAATAIAAKHLARADSQTATIIGCGKQGKIQLLALKEVLPLKRAFVFDRDASCAAAFAAAMNEKIPIQIVHSLPEATRQSDVIATCTTSTEFFLHREHVSSGTFIAAIGADSHGKQELDPSLVAASRVVTDITEQCARMGELHHAIAAGLMTPQNVYGELGQIVSGTKRGRTSQEETFIFDSTGSAIQDVASAAIAYERALKTRIGTFVQLN